MFKNIKKQIKELAQNAVFTAEAELGTSNGQEKKLKAINYVISNLNCSSFVKNIISILLSKFIDEMIEKAVEYMHSLTQEQGE